MSAVQFRPSAPPKSKAYSHKSISLFCFLCNSCVIVQKIWKLPTLGSREGMDRIAGFEGIHRRLNVGTVLVRIAFDHDQGLVS